MVRTVGGASGLSTSRSTFFNSLTGKPIRDEVGEVLAQREALYRAAAHHIIDATATPDEVVEQIMTTVCGVPIA